MIAGVKRNTNTAGERQELMSNESGTKRVRGLVYGIFIEGVCCIYLYGGCSNVAR